MLTNAYTIKLILDNYPLKSITDLDNGKPWDRKWIVLNGKTLSLNDIENGIIRPRFSEPRIHFAVNCAAVSCPPLSSKVFTSDNLNYLLQKRTEAFLQSDLNEISPQNLQLSQIFEWYKEDFGNVVDFVKSYSRVPVAEDASVSYIAYDWALNGN